MPGSAIILPPLLYISAVSGHRYQLWYVRAALDSSTLELYNFRNLSSITVFVLPTPVESIAPHTRFISLPFRQSSGNIIGTCDENEIACVLRLVGYLYSKRYASYI